jgi:phage repressor protein C with HTH and peptisase S24 domain
VRSYLKGATFPDLNQLALLAKATGATFQWLASGTGPELELSGPQINVAGTYDKLSKEGYYGGGFAERARFCRDFNKEDVEVSNETRGSIKSINENQLLKWHLSWKKLNESTRKEAAETPGAYQVEQDFALVPRYDVAASAGHGADVESEQVVDHLAFRRPWLAREGLQEGKLALIQVRGDSMEPTIASGDLLLVDLREQIPAEDGIYVMQTDAHLVAKRVQRLFDGSIYIKSDNQTYQPQQLTPDQVERLQIVGRVVWVARRI